MTAVSEPTAAGEPVVDGIIVEMEEADDGWVFVSDVGHTKPTDRADENE